MTTYESHRVAMVNVLDGMLSHPQGHHGWAGFYESLRAVLRTGDHIPPVLRTCWRERPELSMPHVATLIGMAVQHATLIERGANEIFDYRLPVSQRAAHLDDVLNECGPGIESVILRRHNSFTGARRFLLAQLIVGNYAFGRMPNVRFLDLGTGLGLLPRQLNQRHIFDRFRPHLRVRGMDLPYREIPFECRHGIDRAPLPDLDWVRTCHGPSAYYDERFAEVLWCLAEADPDPPVRITELDLRDSRALTAALADGRYNVVTCNFVLYQYNRRTQARIVDAVLAGLSSPGLFLTTDLHPGMSRPGCVVTAYLSGDRRPLHLAEVSDAHFIGTATAGGDFDDFRRRLTHPDDTA